MATMSWIKKAFAAGYRSGNILFRIPDPVRLKQERMIGGSYRKLFYQAILPHIKSDSHVLEIGPGRGSWTRAVIKFLPEGQITTVDFHDVRPWLRPEKYNGRLICKEVTDNSFQLIQNNYFDFVFSIGVLCHHNQADIKEVLDNTLPKMKQGGIALHHYGDWNKLERYGWKKGHVPTEFKTMSDDEIWWPRNNKDIMAELAQQAGWIVLNNDLDLVKRDSIILLNAQ
jgi:SAM-dependent methyltransferase